MRVFDSLNDVIADILSGISKSESELKLLGHPRSTMAVKRMYLMQIAENFQLVARAAVNGSYDNPFFDATNDVNEGYSNLVESRSRLRARITLLHVEFVTAMEHFGHTWCSKNSKVAQLPEVKPIGFSGKVSGSNEWGEDDMAEFARESIDANSGRELPGLFNPLAVGHLFRRQSVKWDGVGRIFATLVWDACQEFLEKVIQHIADLECGTAILTEYINPVMLQKRDLLEHKLGEVVKPHASTHAITHNPEHSRRVEDEWVTMWSDEAEHNGPITPEKSVLNRMWQYYEVRSRRSSLRVLNSDRPSRFLSALS